GVGVSITANKMRGIRAALCGDTFTAHAAREHNDANVLTMGARVIGKGLAQDIVDTFINTAFAGGRHLERVKKINIYEG
ncbi:MAG: RpiB/LacA/LacB family sugar-phosphate isomerase, partial [Firmicutes bacterium]|nr:RpiB/LacA/LacB family sugar-phosphate isomerase [Bacillota bacterium]